MYCSDRYLRLTKGDVHYPVQGEQENVIENVMENVIEISKKKVEKATGIVRMMSEKCK